MTVNSSNKISSSLSLKEYKDLSAVNFRFPSILFQLANCKHDIIMTWMTKLHMLHHSSKTFNMLTLILSSFLCNFTVDRGRRCFYHWFWSGETRGGDTAAVFSPQQVPVLGSSAELLLLPVSKVISVAIHSSSYPAICELVGTNSYD